MAANRPLAHSATLGYPAEVTTALSFPRLSAPPASPTAGWVYFDTTLNQMRQWDGGNWIAWA